VLNRLLEHARTLGFTPPSRSKLANLSVTLVVILSEAKDLHFLMLASPA
jgi:hypothetical protein